MDITIHQLLRSFTSFPEEFNPSVSDPVVYFNKAGKEFYKSVMDIPFSCDGAYEIDMNSFDQSFTPFKGTECFCLRIMGSGKVLSEVKTYSRKPTAVFSVYAKAVKVEPKKVVLEIPAGFRVDPSCISHIGTASSATGAVRLATEGSGYAEVEHYLPVGELREHGVHDDPRLIPLTVVLDDDCVLCLPPDIPLSAVSDVEVLGTVYVRDTSKLSADVESAIIGSTTLILAPSTKATGGYLYVGLHDGTPPMGKNVKARIAHADEVVPVEKFGGYINLYSEGGVFDFGNRTHKTIEGAKGKADADRPVHQFVVIIGE